MVRVWIAFSPFLLSDLLAQLIAALDGVEIAPHPFSNVDVIIFPLDEFGEPDLGLLPFRLPPAKLLAVSAQADRALVRLADTTRWQELRPFSISELLAEVQAGQQLARPPQPIPAASPTESVRAGLANALAHVRALGARLLAPLTRPAGRRISPALLAVLIVTYYLSLSTLASAEAAMPGQVLYGLKRWAENAQLALASDAADVGLNAQFAGRRLDEIEVLAAQGIVMPALIDDMAQSTEAALTSELPQSQRPALMAQLAELTRRQRLVLSTVRTATRDPATTAALAHALQVSALGHQQVAAVIDTHTGAANPPVLPAAGTPPTSTHMRLVDPTAIATADALVTLSVPSATPTDVPPTASRTPGPTKTPSPTPSDAPSGTATASPVPTTTTAPTATDAPSATFTLTPTATASAAPTAEPTATPSDTPEPTATYTPTPLETDEPTATPTIEATAGEEANDSATPEPTED